MAGREPENAYSTLDQEMYETYNLDDKEVEPYGAATMTTKSISEAREHLADLGNLVSVGHERIIIERRGKHLFALVPMEDLELLEQLEDKLDMDAIRAAADEPTEAWVEVKQQLGL